MKIKRIRALFLNELLHGPKDALLVMAVAVPVLISLFVNLAFGSIFTDRAKLGIYDEGNSRLPGIIAEHDSIILSEFGTLSELQKAAGNGLIDMGIVLPADFDQTLMQGTIRLNAYTWGESLAKNRNLIPVVIGEAARELIGAELPVHIEAVALGDEISLPWSDRLLPFTILIAVFFGGLMIPASSMIHEKQKRTLEALNVSPATIGEIFCAKGMMGGILAIFMALITLSISGSFSNSFWVLFLVLALGAVMASEFGLIAGAFLKDMNTLFAFWKIGGILLFIPSIIFMFPEIPEWIGYIFPTFYILKPIMDISISGVGFSDVALYIGILGLLVLLFGAVVVIITRKLSTQALRLNG